MRSCAFAFVCLCLSFVPPVQGQTRIESSSVSVDESSIRASLQSNSTVIEFPIRSASPHPIHADLLLEWLNPENLVVGSATRNVQIDASVTRVDVPLPLPVSTIWLRLHYTLTPAREDARAFARQTGIVALPHIAAHVFTLNVSYVGVPVPGKPITVYAQAVHPVTHAAVADVSWNGSLSIGDESLKPSSILRHKQGTAEITFQLPTSSQSGDIELDDTLSIEITGRRGDFEQSVSTEAPWLNHLSARVQTDKSIYQPGQTIHIRALVTDPSGQPREAAKVTLHIATNSGDRVHTASLVASRFGIIHEDWSFPSTAQLDNYRISVIEGADDIYTIGSHVVRLSRYDLPEFSVTVKPDRGAYMPGQDPRITVTAAYLFGKPVPRGRVKIVRSDEPRWNPKTRKSEPADETVVEGQAADDGSFVAHLDLRAQQAALPRDERFEDLHFAAYYTDSLSQRTEQRRFDIRISREPIHIYVIHSENGSSLYISTSYADGKPAQVVVEARLPNRILTVSTNRYGVGKADISPGEILPDYAEFRAADSSGQTGSWTEHFWQTASASVHLKTNRTLYRAGEPVSIDIAAPPALPGDNSLVLSAIAGDRVVSHQVVSLTNGIGRATFPWQPEFQRAVVFVAWNAGDDGSLADNGETAATRTVIFPDQADLHVTALANRGVYRPGEKATLRFRVAANDGHPAVAALGVAVVDQSVLDQVRTDNEFGSRSWFSCAFCTDQGESEIGGVRLNDLYSMKPSSPISPDLDLVAEALVATNGVPVASDTSESLSGRTPFASVPSQISLIRSALDRSYEASLDFPENAGELASAAGAAWSGARDPWGMPYLARFSIERDQRVIQIMSSGPDKKAGTEDDFVVGTFEKPYFALYTALIRSMLKPLEDYPATEAEFRGLLRAGGISIETLSDPWGTPYRVRIDTAGRQRVLSIVSAGPDRNFETSDDVTVGRFAGEYFERERSAIRGALQKAPVQPQTIDDFRQILTNAGIDLSRYRDAWGRSYRLLTRTSSRYADRVDTAAVRVFGNPEAAIRTNITPVTRHVLSFVLHSAGADGIDDTYDDFDIADFPVILSEQSAHDNVPPTEAAARQPAGTGLIAGIVTDASGAVIPNTRITLTNSSGDEYSAISGDDGSYEFRAVPAGAYSLRVTASGFMAYVVTAISVPAGKDVEVDVQLQVASTTESISVQAAPLLLETQSAAVSGVATSTPRVREYFPETLLWIPEVVTDASGNASTQFTLADTVTTWKVAVFASTLDGRTSEAETDLKAYQPFFLDFNSPAVLTEGDRLELPVTVRNYQPKTEKVSLKANNADSLAIDDSPSKQVVAAPNTSVNVSWIIRAKAINDAAVERISATSSDSHDAIAKTIHIRPDGQEVTKTQGGLFAGRSSLSIVIPPAAIPGATRAELRLYPNIASLLLESAAGILETPHGCAEQTISAGYANLVALRYLKVVGVTHTSAFDKATRNISAAVEGLGAFSASTGAVSYWAGGESDVAVTAYALNFLVDVSPFLNVDPDDLKGMVGWIERQQRTDGTWAAGNENTPSAERRRILLTSLVARALADAQKAGIAVKPETLTTAYGRMASLTDSIDEPYMLAQFILAALDSGDERLLGNAVSRLVAAGHQEAGTAYWDLQTNSPFYGWGTAGRFETTALTVSALSAWHARHPQSTELDPAIREGLAFLLKSRGQYGGWNSTQATLRTMQAIADASPLFGAVGKSGGDMEIRLGGRVVKRVSLPADTRALDPIRIDISSFLAPGENRLELASTASQGPLVLSWLSSTYWLPWAQAEPRKSPELRLDVNCGDPTVSVGQLVHCAVKAERVGFKGYGMMLAEIGLPPGADVDRSTLESIVDDPALGVNHYDLLPDRIVFYLWPKADGSSFEFSLRARMPMAAKSSASILYDYYNPEAVSEVRPVRWNAK